MSTRSGKRLRSPVAPVATKASNNRKTDTRKRPNTSNRGSKRAREGQQDDQQGNDLDRDEENLLNPNDDETHPEFTSNFPELTFDNVEEQLDKWTLVELRNALKDQKKRTLRHKNQAPSEIKTFVELVRRDYEKRMLMAALIGGISETMIWSLVDAGPKKKNKLNCYARFLSFGKEALEVEVPSRNVPAGWGRRNKILRDKWKEKSVDQQMVFRDPFFFALAKLPDLSLSNEDHVQLEDDNGEIIDNHNPAAQVSAPKIHQLCKSDEIKYRPIYEDLVDVEKVHANHGKPESTDSMQTMQLKSLAAFRAAHHDFATVCQRFHIHYHLTALSCDVEDGWNRVLSTDKTFSTWAEENLKLSTKFKYYVHGKVVAQEIEKKLPQPVDARRGELTRELNKLLINQYCVTSTTQDVHMPGKIFPKTGNPFEVIADKGWPIRLNLKRPESLLLPEELALGFRDCNDALKKNWLSDIQSGHFTIEKIPASEIITMKRKPKNKSSKKSKSKSKSTQPHAASPVNTQEHTRNDGTAEHAESQPIPRTQTAQTLPDQTHSQQIVESSRKKKSKKSKKPAKKLRRDDDESSEYKTASESDPDESDLDESDPESN
ncbi:uncharacterized protein MELLADRAFT_86363 [Melampsora larici-populina 98AG31]|uniref:Uncharacterized protein n=1 Tax=Melampsora larici-populina (strain 98AG31 / pathotype 3-4-7) TaxID=747676 RepID=F4RLJ6_MELLP|nr:uncharacterized protein MELLADRAFT_86363 [Melampsora larici-populina 98AG31]EGG06548.1 hypothetical protein MELLADRAFT_86363 [Melampsora larici-populina 98AG31]